MKKIKRLLMLSLCVCLSLTLCACDNKENDNKETVSIDGEEITFDMDEEIALDELDRGFTASYDDLSDLY